MYVCLCKGVTEKDIRKAVDQGAVRMRDLKACLDITTQCGTCACHAKQVLEQALKEKKSARSNGSNTACVQANYAYEV